MAELIDRNEILKVLTHRVKGNEENHIILGTNNTLSLVEEWVRSIQTVDAVPVVRCKDCKYWFKNNGHDKSNCPIVDPHIWIDDDGFCSYGERKKDHE